MSGHHAMERALEPDTILADFMDRQLDLVPLEHLDHGAQLFGACADYRRGLLFVGLPDERLDDIGGCSPVGVDVLHVLGLLREGLTRSEVVPLGMAAGVCSAQRKPCPVTAGRRRHRTRTDSVGLGLPPRPYRAQRLEK